jgi:glycerol uptake facilitator-like aquaporin
MRLLIYTAACILSPFFAVEPGACFLDSTNLLNIALAFGLSIFVLVYAAASFSGACHS